MIRGAKQLVVLIATLGLVLVGGGAAYTAGPAAASPAPSKTIEAKYAAAGPWAVSKQENVEAAAKSGKFDIWYPKGLEATSNPLPIITWGNGTSARPKQYDYLLTHLASWGFVVVASQNTNTGSGEDMLRGVDYLRVQNVTPSSTFYQRLDLQHVGAMGHSQGAIGAINSAVKSRGVIKSTIPIELPSQVLCKANAPKPDPSMVLCANPSKITATSVFYVNGSDSFISPSFQRDSLKRSGIESVRGYYDATPDSVDKAMATLIGPNHNDIQGQPNCTPGNVGCVQGVKGFLGLLTAWNRAQLQGNREAASVFVAGSGEFFKYPEWINQASNIRD